MKKTVLLAGVLIVTLLTAPALVAQQAANSDRELSFGVRGGLSLYSIESEVSGGFFGNVSETSGSKIGFSAGVFAEIPINNILSFQPELLFVQKGGSDGGDPFDGDDFFDDDEDISLTLNYIDLPLLARANVPLEGNLTPYLVAGPSVGFLVSASESSGEDGDITEFFKSTNFGFVIGAGIDIGNFTVDLRYDIGLTNILDDSIFDDQFDDDDDFFDDIFDDIDFTQKTSGIHLTVGVRF